MDVVIGGSTGTSLRGSGLIPRCISNRAEGMQGSDLEARLSAPIEEKEGICQLYC